MPNIQKANAFHTWWVGVSPKHNIKHRFNIRAGLTDEEIKVYIEKALKRIDDREDKEIEKELYELSDEYTRSKLPYYKNQSLENLKKALQQMNDNNNSRFAGGYTGPAIMDHKAEVERIKRYEETEKAKIETNFNGSAESLKYVRQLMDADKEREQYKYNSTHRVNSLHPRVGGYAGRHAAAHGGGFNHPGVYAGNVWN